MAVQFVDEIFSSGVKSSVDSQAMVSATATRAFQVFVNNVSDTELDVRADARVPRELDFHPLFTNMFCRGVDISRKGPLSFSVTATYSGPEYEEGQPGTQDPTEQPNQVSFFTISSEEPIDEDADGNAITTECGEPINGLTRPISDLGIRIQKNYKVFDPASFYLFIDCVNSDTFIGFPAGTLRIANISADRQFFVDSNRNTIEYWSVQLEIHARKPYRTTADKAWYKRFRHEGYYNKDLVTNEIVRAVDENKEPVSQPVQLDQNGYKFANQNDAFWLERRVFENVSFASLGL